MLKVISRSSLNLMPLKSLKYLRNGIRKTIRCPLFIIDSFPYIVWPTFLMKVINFSYNSSLYSSVCYTFAWKKDGMSVFKNGKYSEFMHNSMFFLVKEVYVNTSGTVRMDINVNYPAWAMTRPSMWLKNKFPIMFDTATKLSLRREIKVGDYIIILAKKFQNTTMNVKLERCNSSYVPIYFLFE